MAGHIRPEQSIEDLVIREYPFPIASCYQKMVKKKGQDKWRCLLDLFSSFIHFLVTIVLSTYWRNGLSDQRFNRFLLAIFYKGKWNTRDLLELLRETIILYRNNYNILPYPELFHYLLTSDGKPTKSFEILNHFVDLFNNNLQDGNEYGNEFFQNKSTITRQYLDEELRNCYWLTACSLWLPKHISDDGEVLIVDILRGSNRNKDHKVSLRLNLADIDIYHGDVILEKTLLLVNETKMSYLPLSPFSLFYFHPEGQDQFFLSDLDWEQKTDQLKQVQFLSYNSNLNKYEAFAEDPITKRIGSKVVALTQCISKQTVPLYEQRKNVHEVVDYNLPEVWAEQDYHLKSFVGRTILLESFGNRILTKDSGYFLLVGPPGQGKSALLSHFAYLTRINNKICLFHMVKSHREPKRFMQFLIWQAQKLLTNNEANITYETTLVSLRSQLVTLLIKLQQQFNKVVVIIDALDEIDYSNDRFSFLPEFLPKGVQIFLSARRDIPLIEQLKLRLENLQVTELSPLTTEELLQLLSKQFSDDLLIDLKKKIDFQALFKHTEGNPLFIKRALENIVEIAKKCQEQNQPLEEISIELFPNTAEAVSEEIYLRIAEKVKGKYITEEGRLRARLIQLLAIAKEPLKIDDLCKLLRASGTKITLEETRDLIVQMSSYLLLLNGERMLPFHQALIDYIQNIILGPEGLTNLHKIFYNWLLTPQQKFSSYYLYHLPFHLMGSIPLSKATGSTEDSVTTVSQLVNLLTDFEFIKRKIEAGLTFELVRDYQSALLIVSKYPQLDSTRILNWAQFIDSESHILSNNPQLFIQQAINQPVDSIIEKSAKLYLHQVMLEKSYIQWLNKPTKISPSILKRTLCGHNSGINSIVLSADNRTIISASSDKTIKVWDLSTGQMICSFLGQSDNIFSLSLTNGDKQLISGDSEGNIRFWKLQNYQLISCITIQKFAVLAMAVTLDDKYLICCGARERNLSCWSLSTESVLKPFDTYNTGMPSIAISPDCENVIGGAIDGTLIHWNFSSRQIIKLWAAHDGWVNTVIFSPNGRTVVSGGNDNKIKLWHWPTTKEIATLKGHTGSVTALAITADNKYLISGSSDKTVRVWDLVNNKEVAILTGHTDEVSSVLVTIDGKTIISASKDTTLKIWDLPTCLQNTSRMGHNKQISAIAVTADYQIAVTASGDSTLKVWDLFSLTEIKTLIGHKGWIWDVVVTANGQSAISVGSDQTIRLWDLTTMAEQNTLKGHLSDVLTVVVTADNRFILSGSLDNTIRIWDLISGKHLKTLRGHLGGVYSLQVGLDGHYAVSVGFDCMRRVWDLWQFREIKELAEPCHDVNTSIALSPDGKFRITGLSDSTIKIVEIDTEQEIARFVAPGSIWECTALSDGKFVCGNEFGQLYFLKLIDSQGYSKLTN